MCGIAGIIDTNLNQDDATSLMNKMLASILHRGPDNSWQWLELPVVFGHNRLSIIDLSDNANQPMEYGDFIITYNGEVYNYLEVKKKLVAKGYAFTTKSDTEVILAAYKEYGENCVEYFVGMWAFAIWDKKKKNLFCSRDRFGIKPFYYIHQGNKFYFGSEYKPLKLTPIFRNGINQLQISRGLQLGWVTYHDETYFEVIKQIPAAHNLIFKDGNVTVKKYWDIDLTQKFNGSFEEKKNKFYELFIDSIKLHTRSDVEVGGCLSGGLDSSSIISAAVKNFPSSSFKTFTIFYEGENGVDERPWVNEVLKKYPQIDPDYFSPSENDLMENFEKAIYFADVPLTGSSPISQYFVMKLASQHKMKVLLDGQGSDECLAGYMHSFYRLLGGMSKNFNLLAATKTLLQHKKQQGFSFGKTVDVLLKSKLAAIFSEQSLYNLEYKNYFPFLTKQKFAHPFSLKNNAGTRLNNFLYHLTFNTSLPSLLHFEDRNSMAFSIESRVPFLDHRLVEFIFSLADEDKINQGETKYILRKSLAPILPETITNRKDKKGFVTPGEVKWLRGSLKFLVDADFNNIDFINQTKAKMVIEDFKKGNNKNANLVWRLAVLNYWLKNN